ncbi:MAG: DNA replication/repair protein RecF [Verrucomicrobia bacterium]|nr:DNA replication/repair protein RecF [Verrucomicrobiota bacterium]
MYVAHLRLRDFRNYPRLDVDFSPGFHLLLGDNAQGKTNLLEAIYLLATLRSFRGASSEQLVRHGQRWYFVGCNLVGPARHDIKLFWSATQRKLTLDGQDVRRLADYLGTLRAVVFCSEDLQLVKGPASRRRRFMDLLLSQTQPTYLPTLQRYMRAVRARNALLKHAIVDEAALDGFTNEVVRAGNEIMKQRRNLAPKLGEMLRLAYRNMSGAPEELRTIYKPSVDGDLAVALAQSRQRERVQRITLFGPHRDDLVLLLDDKPASVYASEGQKRTIALAMKMAQTEYVTALTGSPPILLIDDVMGELDNKRRAGFLPLLELARKSGGQVFLTCTAENWPHDLALDLTRWRVQNGRLSKVG